MNFQRKIERNQLKKQFKNYNKGIAKKYRTNFADFWKKYKKGKKGNE